MTSVASSFFLPLAAAPGTTPAAMPVVGAPVAGFDLALASALPVVAPMPVARSAPVSVPVATTLPLSTVMVMPVAVAEPAVQPLPVRAPIAPAPTSAVSLPIATGVPAPAIAAEPVAIASVPAPRAPAIAAREPAASTMRRVTPAPSQPEPLLEQAAAEPIAVPAPIRARGEAKSLPAIFVVAPLRGDAYVPDVARAAVPVKPAEAAIEPVSVLPDDAAAAVPLAPRTTVPNAAAVRPDLPVRSAPLACAPLQAAAALSNEVVASDAPVAEPAQAAALPVAIDAEPSRPVEARTVDLPITPTDRPQPAPVMGAVPIVAAAPPDLAAAPVMKTSAMRGVVGDEAAPVVAPVALARLDPPAAVVNHPAETVSAPAVKPVRRDPSDRPDPEPAIVAADPAPVPVLALPVPLVVEPSPQRVASLTPPAPTPTSTPTPTDRPRLEASSPPDKATVVVDAMPAAAEPRATTDAAAPLPTFHPANRDTPLAPAPRAPVEAGAVAAQPGRIGHEMGVVIARHAAAGGGEAITVRLDPAEMGRVEVTLSFDDGGRLRAVVAADNPAALDLLRRDSADLNRALADAGVRHDQQSLRFDTRSSGGDQPGGHAWQRRHDQHAPRGDPADATATPDTDPTRPRAIDGRIDMMA